MCTRQSRKVIWDTINSLFLTLQLSNLLLLLSLSTRKHTSMASRAILSNFFEEQRTQNHPEYLSGLWRALFPTTFLKVTLFKNAARDVMMKCTDPVTEAWTKAHCVQYFEGVLPFQKVESLFKIQKENHLFSLFVLFNNARSQKLGGCFRLCKIYPFDEICLVSS